MRPHEGVWPSTLCAPFDSPSPLPLPPSPRDGVVQYPACSPSDSHSPPGHISTVPCPPTRVTRATNNTTLTVAIFSDHCLTSVRASKEVPTKEAGGQRQTQCCCANVHEPSLVEQRPSSTLKRRHEGMQATSLLHLCREHAKGWYSRAGRNGILRLECHVIKPYPYRHYTLYTCRREGD